MATFADVGIILKEQKNGLQYLPCPKCGPSRKNSNKPSLTVNVENNNNWFTCHNDGCDFSGNLEVLERYAKVKESARMPKTIKMYSPKVRDYIKSRGLSMSTYLNDGVYEAEYNNKTILAYPIKISHTLVNVKFRDLDWTKESKFPRFWQTKKVDGAKSCFIGLDSLDLPKDHDIDRKPNVVIIVEGQDDRLTIKECGFKNVLSVPSGAPSLTSEKYEREFDYVTEGYFDNINKNLIDCFILFVDNDPAGEKLKSHLATILGKHRCKYVKYPEGYKDSNEVYAGHGKFMKPLGKSYVASMIDTAKPFPVSGIIDPEQIENDIIIYRERGYERGHKCSIEKLNNLFTLKEPYLCVLTGNAKTGKTTWLRWYIMDLIKNILVTKDKSLRLAYWSPEARPRGREMSKMIESVVGKPIYKGDPGSMSDFELENATTFVKNHIIYMLPERKQFNRIDQERKTIDNNTLAKIFEHLAYLVRAYGISGYIIDPWNSIYHNPRPGETIEFYLGRVLDTINAFNEMYGLFCVLVVHPTSVVKRLKNGNYERPGVHLASGGAMWRNKIDLGLTVHRDPWVQIDGTDDEYYYDNSKPTQVHIDFVKFEELGNYGRLNMDFESGMFYAEGVSRDNQQAIINFEDHKIESEIDIEKLLEDKHGTLPF